MLQYLIRTDAQPTTVIIRLMVGAVFLSEGIQKFLFAGELGAGRFARIGLLRPELLGPFVGTCEILCGILILAGFLTRLASVPLMVIMLVAIATTKAGMLSEKGFWTMLHESRTDWSMLLGSFFLFIRGGGRWSMDHKLQHKL